MYNAIENPKATNYGSLQCTYVPLITSNNNCHQKIEIYREVE